MGNKMKKIIDFIISTVVFFSLCILFTQWVGAEEIPDPIDFTGATEVGNTKWTDPDSEFHKEYNVYLNDTGKFLDETAKVPKRGPAYIELNKPYKTRMDNTLGSEGNVYDPGTGVYYYFTLETATSVTIYGQCSTASNSKLSIEKIDSIETFEPSTEPFGVMIGADEVKTISTCLSAGYYLVSLDWGQGRPDSVGKCCSYVKVVADHSINQEMDDWYETFPNMHIHAEPYSGIKCQYICTPYKIGKTMHGVTSVGNLDRTTKYYVGCYSFTISERTQLNFEGLNNINYAYVFSPSTDHNSNDNKITDMGNTMTLEPGDYILQVQAKSKGEYSFRTSASSASEPPAAVTAGVDTMAESGWSVEGETVTINNLNVNSGDYAEFCIWSGDIKNAGYGKGLAKLVIKGDCYIRTLVIDCPVEVTCESGAKLVVGELVVNTDEFAGGNLTYSDGTTYNATTKTFEESKAHKEPDHEHTWDVKYTVDKAPTCEEPGVKSIHCTLCSEKKDVTEIPAFGHDWDEGIITKQPTQTEKGIKTITCKNDKSHIRTVEVPTLEVLGDVVTDDIDENVEKEIASDNVWITGVEDVIYSGSAVTFDIRAYKGNKLIKEGTDYTIKYKNNKKACRDYSEQNASKIPTITLTGKGAYRDVNLTKAFKIEPIDLNASETLASNAVVEVKGSAYKPIPTLNVNGKKLKHKTDYIVVYDSAHDTGFKEVGDYSIKLEGIGNYRGTVVSSFKIVNKNEYTLLSKATVTGYAKKFAYDGTAKEQNKSDIVVKAKVGRTTETLTEGTDYTISYLNNTEVGTASMIIKAVPGSKKYLGEKVINYKITGTPLSKARVTYEKKHIYTGATIKPAVTLALVDGTKLTEGKDYTLEYQKNVNAGTGSIVITGKGAYTGTGKKSFKIKPIELKDEAPFTVEIKSVLPKNEKGTYTVDIEVRNNGKLLVKGIDYTLSYKNNKAPRKADDDNAPSVMIKGKGNYTKNIIKLFTITE